MKKFITGLSFEEILSNPGISTVTGTPSPQKPVDVLFSAQPIHRIEELSSFLDNFPYETGFFAKNLKTGKIVERFADRSICLASIVKVFCLTELYRQKQLYSLDLNQNIDIQNQGHISLKQAADLMIGQSDNAATQSLTIFLGRDNVNRIPSLLGLEAMSDNILPDENILGQTLDKRIWGERQAAANLPQHGTARDMATYFELLSNDMIISGSVSQDIIEFFTKHPKPFSTHYTEKYIFLGKGGNLLWNRPPKYYSMMGWSLLLTTPTNNHIVLCVWGEWFPEDISPEQQAEFLKFVSDSAIAIAEN